MSLDISGSPYFDDFNESKKFVKILFRPSYAVQARELTQLQTTIQYQLGKFGSHIFANGSRVIDGQTAYESRATSLKITSIDLDFTTNINNFFRYFTIDTNVITLDQVRALIISQGYLSTRNGIGGLTFNNGNSIVRIVAVYPAIDANTPATIICQQMSGVVPTDNTTFTNATTGVTFTTITSNSVNNAAFYSINSGVYFINSLFVYVEKQTVVVSKYDNTPTARIGLIIKEYIVTSDTDASLLDPARGSNNFNAAGADRLAIDLILSTKPVDTLDPINNASGSDYIDITRIVKGAIVGDVRDPIYSDLEDTLARRTYDESGDYTVVPFDVQFRDHPTDNTKLQVGLGAGVAYIHGHEFRTISTSWLDVDKARTTGSIAQEVVPTIYGSYIYCDTGTGTVTGVLPTSIQDTVTLWDTVTSGTQIGTAKVRLVYRETSTKIRVYIYDVVMSSSSFAAVRSIRYTGGVRYDILLTAGNAVINEPSNNSLLFNQNFNNLKTFTAQSYYYLKPVAVNSASWTGAGPYVATNISAGVGEQFITGDATSFSPYMVIDSNGVVRTITALSITSGAMTITISTGSTVPGNCTVYALSYRNAASVRSKTLNTNTVNIAAVNSLSTYSLNNGTRNYYDGVALVSAKHSSANTVERLTDFTFFSGQTDNYYGVASVTQNGGAVYSSGTWTFIFTSFDHSNDASGSGVFTVDSYTNVSYENIPVYTSKTTGANFNLSDTIDFRPTITDTVGSTVVKYQNLPIPVGSVAEFIGSYQYYLPRRDKVNLTPDKAFVVTKGIPSLTPLIPSTQTDSMLLYTLDVPAYTFTSKSVVPNFIENRRYTMRDIGKIEQRVSRVEYYTALSLLEKQAKDQNLLTSAGVSAFKNGILVDSFAGHSVGDVTNPEYLCSIDYNERFLRPTFASQSVKLSRISGGTLSTNNIVTLPYTSKIFIDQPLSSNVINVTPYDFVSWLGLGNIALTPSSDIWYDQSVAGDVVVNVNGSYDQLKATFGLGTVWNDWTTSWVGSSYLERTDSDNMQLANGVYERREVYATNIGVTRTGIRTDLKDLGTTRDSGTTSVNTSVATFMRQISVTFTANGMKPYTRVYAYFDDKPVSTGTVFTTDVFGSITGTFTIPSGVYTGTRLFRLSDLSALSLDPKTETTSAVAKFTAAGTIETTQTTFVATRQYGVVNTTLTDSQTTIREEYGATIPLPPPPKRPIDPVAQSFFVNSREYPNGLYLSSVDIYFYTKSSSLPVFLQIRPMVNGFPSSNDILPMSSVTLNPSSVNVVVNPYSPNPNTDNTRFNFSTPIYLAPGLEYCFVLLANTTDYQVFMATMGNTQLGTNNIIAKQPSSGSLFKSQNASTWTPTQESDLMFRLNQCVFSKTPETVIMGNSGTDTFTQNRYHLQNFVPSAISFSSATVNWGFKGIPTGSVLESSFSPLQPANNISFGKEYQIAAGSSNQIQYQAVLSTIDSNVTPLIDFDRTHTIIIQNIVSMDYTNENLAKIGTALAKYETRKVKLASGFESVGLNVTFDAYLPGISNVIVYYKLANTGTVVDFDNQGWTLLSAASQTLVSRLDTSLQYTEYNFKTSGTLPLFNLYSIKLVMIGDGNNVPLVKDLRVIAFI
jgi:hypothetical protein